MTTPLTLEWDESGLRLSLDLTLLDDPDVRYDGGEVSKVLARIDTSSALDLYEHVRRELGEWYSEAASARAAVASGGTLAEYVGADEGDVSLDPLDPKSPGYAENLAALGDAQRKERRENP